MAVPRSDTSETEGQIRELAAEMFRDHQRPGLIFVSRSLVHADVLGVRDALGDEAGEHLDLIVSSMTLHWLAEPVASLERLRQFLAPSGAILYATLGTDSFAEWRAVLAEEDLPSGLADISPLPGVIEEERLVPDADTLSFLRRMKAVGGLTPKEGYAPLSPGALRRAIHATDARFGGRITWHIVYGALKSPEASRSSPASVPA